MAKRTKGGGETGVGNGKSIEGFAEDLGRILGHARNKADGWLNQRTAIVKQLTQLRDEASKLLTDLGHGAQAIVRRGRPAGDKHASTATRGPGRPKDSGKRKRKPMSAEARAKISAAQKKRWAKQKAAGKK
jgi:hypothetical protein